MPQPPGAARVTPRRLAARRFVAFVVGSVLVAASLAAAPPPAAAASTTAAVASELLVRTNLDRAARGLRPLRGDPRLAAIGRERAANLASSAYFTHVAAGGSLTPRLEQAGVQWYAWAEDIAWVSGGLSSTTAGRTFDAWKQSPSHWDVLMSATLNYVGFGAVLRASDGRVFVSAVLTESPDHTAPRGRMTRATRAGTTLEFSWTGYDPLLQSHWAGLRDFDVWYRVDEGAWRRIREDTTATTIRLAGRASGHRYWLRVQPRDRAGNVGPPSTALSIWIP
jgi:uncharacterized protein YkwD